MWATLVSSLCRLVRVNSFSPHSSTEELIDNGRIDLVKSFRELIDIEHVRQETLCSNTNCGIRVFHIGSKNAGGEAAGHLAEPLLGREMGVFVFGPHGTFKTGKPVATIADERSAVGTRQAKPRSVTYPTAGRTDTVEGEDSVPPEETELLTRRGSSTRDSESCGKRWWRPEGNPEGYARSAECLARNGEESSGWEEGESPEKWRKTRTAESLRLSVVRVNRSGRSDRNKARAASSPSGTQILTIFRPTALSHLLTSGGELGQLGRWLYCNCLDGSSSEARSLAERNRATPTPPALVFFSTRPPLADSETPIGIWEHLPPHWPKARVAFLSAMVRNSFSNRHWRADHEPNGSDADCVVAQNPGRRS